jgi:hypothetical protein
MLKANPPIVLIYLVCNTPFASATTISFRVLSLGRSLTLAVPLTSKIFVGFGVLIPTYPFSWILNSSSPGG